MRTDFCKQCGTSVSAPNYSMAQSLIVEHNYREHFTIDEMIEDWKKGNRAVVPMFRSMMDRTGFNDERMMKTLIEDGHGLFVRVLKMHRKYVKNTILNRSRRFW